MSHPKQMNSLILAYIGDAYFEVLVRDFLVTKRNILKPKLLQKEAIEYVSAKAQVGFMKVALENGWLRDDEIKQFKRGRNTKNKRTSKNLDAITHNKSTGFESIIGYYYLIGNFDRINEIFANYISHVEINKAKRDNFESNMG